MIVLALRMCCKLRNHVFVEADRYVYHRSEEIFQNVKPCYETAEMFAQKVQLYPNTGIMIDYRQCCSIETSQTQHKLLTL